MITIFHDPESTVSRDALALIRNSGAEPQIILLRQDPPTWDRLVDLIRRIDLPVRSLLCTRHPLYQTLDLSDPSCSDDTLLDAMIRHPELIICPIVETPLGVRLARPAETVLNLLPNPQIGPFAKEDGQPVIDGQGRRIDRGALD